jgi:hypothetical protein
LNLATTTDSDARNHRVTGFGQASLRRDRQFATDRVIPFGERHLRQTIAEFVEHYHRERTHQGLANELIEGAPVVEEKVGRIRRHPWLGGLLNYYDRAA